jgi:hypothetical protein
MTGCIRCGDAGTLKRQNRTGCVVQRVRGDPVGTPRRVLEPSRSAQHIQAA